MANRPQDKFCCVNCFDDAEIQDFINSADQTGDCDYCGSKKVIIAEVCEVGRFIKGGIERVYEDAAEHVPHDSGEGGYQFPTETIRDILNDAWSWIF